MANMCAKVTSTYMEFTLYSCKVEFKNTFNPHGYILAHIALKINICFPLGKKFARLTHHYYNIFMGNPLTSSKDLSISLLKLLECRMQWYIDFITWTSRPYFRLITGSSFTVFVLCRLNHIRCIRVTHSSLNR
jgi:hypothetical protein